MLRIGQRYTLKKTQKFFQVSRKELLFEFGENVVYEAIVKLASLCLKRAEIKQAIDTGIKEGLFFADQLDLML